MNGLDYVDEKEFEKVRKKLNARHEKILARARGILSPMNLRSVSLIGQESSQYGCYVLVQLSGGSNVYVGRSQNVKQRIAQHPKKYDLFASEDCKNQRNMETTEMALYHLVEDKLRENEHHPPPAQDCPFC